MYVYRKASNKRPGGYLFRSPFRLALIYFIRYFDPAIIPLFTTLISSQSNKVNIGNLGHKL